MRERRSPFPASRFEYARASMRRPMRNRYKVHTAPATRSVTSMATVRRRRSR
ncbi:hypothetical protein [Lysobacter gummosus]|uniref:hypothetical protein n=1 Tax=Lysobacter gummosus TaxID=262324 RepID=UPI00363AA362